MILLLALPSVTDFPASTVRPPAVIASPAPTAAPQTTLIPPLVVIRHTPDPVAVRPQTPLEVQATQTDTEGVLIDTGDGTARTNKQWATSHMQIDPGFKQTLQDSGICDVKPWVCEEW